MKTLLLMRHAKSGWDNPALSDHDRPLNPRGERDAPEMGRLLVHAAVIPDRIVCSSAVRAKRTAEMVHESLNAACELQVIDHLYHAPPKTWFSVIRELPDAANCVLIIGHNPGLEETLLRITGEPHRMPTAAVAHLAVPIDRWEEFASTASARLVEIWRPKEID